MAKTSVAPAKFVMPIVVLLSLSDVFIAWFEVNPVANTLPTERLDFISPQAHHYLRDLVQSIPIRGPSLLA